MKGVANDLNKLDYTSKIQAGLGTAFWLQTEGLVNVTVFQSRKQVNMGKSDYCVLGLLFSVPLFLTAT